MMTIEHHFRAGALENVFLSNGFTVTDGDYGTTTQYEDILGLYRAIVNAVLSKPARLIGTEVAFLRDRLDMFQSELGELLGVKEQTVSLWERSSHFIPKACDLVLRRLCIETFKQSLSKDVKNFSIFDLSTRAETQQKLHYVATYSHHGWRMESRVEDAKFLASKVATKGTVVIGNISNAERVHWVEYFSAKLARNPLTVAPVQAHLDAVISNFVAEASIAEPSIIELEAKHHESISKLKSVQTKNIRSLESYHATSETCH